MTDTVVYNMYLINNESCGQSDTVSQTITPMQGMIGLSGTPDPPLLARNKTCVDGAGEKAMLTGSAPTGGTMIWNNGMTGSPILVENGSFWAWAVNSYGASTQSLTLNIGIC